MTEQTTAARPRARACPPVSLAAPEDAGRRAAVLLACGAAAGPLFVAAGLA